MVTIRAVEPGDRASWEQLWGAYLAFYETSATTEVYETAFTRLLGNDAQDFHGALAIVDGKPVGLVHYLFHRNLWKIENVCYLQDLYADPAVRGQGVGRALIEHVYQAADAQGAPSVYWLTQEFNTEARKLYDRIGTLTPFIRYNRG